MANGGSCYNKCNVSHADSDYCHGNPQAERLYWWRHSDDKRRTDSGPQRPTAQPQRGRWPADPFDHRDTDGGNIGGAPRSGYPRTSFAANEELV